LQRCTAFVVGLVALLATEARAEILKPRLTDFAAKYKAFTLVLGPTRRIVYCSNTGTLHQYETRNGKLVETRTRDLWSPVNELLAVDLDRDGQDEIVGITKNARLFVLNGNDMGDIWNTVEGRLKVILSIAIGDVDQDGQLEILLVADGLLRVYSGMQDIEEWKSTISFTATDMALGDVDGDGRDELVLNTGQVFDAYYRSLEWNYEPGFGVEIDLFDIDNDGKPEVIGLSADGLIRVFDVDERRLKFN